MGKLSLREHNLPGNKNPERGGKSMPKPGTGCESHPCHWSLYKSSPCSDVECGEGLDSWSPRVPISLVFGDSMEPGTSYGAWH